MSLAAILLTSWALASLAYRCIELRELGKLGERARQAELRPKDPGEALSALTLARPLCGAPPWLAESLGSLFRAAEPHATPIALSIADSEDAAHEHVRALRAAHPKVPTTVATGRAGPGQNRKIANLLQLELFAHEPASGDTADDVIVLTDADIRVPESLVPIIAEAFADPAVGYATATYRSIPARGLASRIDAHLQNLYFLPSTCLSVALEGLNFGLGSTLAFRRDALASIGGLEGLRDEAADDGRLAKRIHATGVRGAWLPLIVDHLLDDAGLQAALRRHLRCARATRSLRPLGFLGLVAVTHGWLPALLAGASLGGAPASIAAGVAWWAAVAASQAPRRREIPMRGSDLLLGPFLDGLTLAIQVAAHVGKPTGPEAPASAPAKARTHSPPSQKS